MDMAVFWWNSIYKSRAGPGLRAVAFTLLLWPLTHSYQVASRPLLQACLFAHTDTLGPHRLVKEESSISSIYLPDLCAQHVSRESPSVWPSILTSTFTSRLTLGKARTL